MPNAIWRPYTQEKITSPGIVVDRAEGSYIYAKDGRKIFDGISSWWVITHGHCHPKIVETIQRQAAKIDQVIFANFSHAPAEELSERLVRLTPEKLSRVFFSDNGSTAVEVALKMALQACIQRGFSQRKKIVAFSKGYHGDTVGAMSVSGESLFTRPYRNILFEIVRATQPENPMAPVQKYLEDFTRLIQEESENIAAVLIEPLIQGAGGMVMWPKEAVVKIAQLCRQHGVYLIFDEVMTGFGRTGALFAMDQLGVTPDLLCLSKGLTGGTLPLSVTLASEEIYQAFLSEEKTKMFFHGHSFTGNPIACAAALASLELFDEEKTLSNIEMIRGQNEKGLSQLASKAPIKNPRLCGVVAAFEVESDENNYGSRFSELLTQRCLEQELFLRPLGNTVYLMPPYCATQSDLEAVWDKVVHCVRLSVNP